MSEKNVSREKDTLIYSKKELGIGIWYNPFNKARIRGVLEDNFRCINNWRGENIYESTICVAREGGMKNHIPIIISESILRTITKAPIKGKFADVMGELRSRNVNRNGEHHVKTFLYIKRISLYDRKEDLTDEISKIDIYLEGYIFKEPIFRTTISKKEIVSLAVKVPRGQEKFDFLFCTTWAKAAKYAKNLKVGDKVRILGVIKSRKYFKTISPETGEGEYRTAYEVMVIKLTKITDI